MIYHIHDDMRCSELWKSTDGGKNWTGIKGAPGGDDYHRIWINPNDPKIMAIGLDQGGTITVNGGETWSSWYNQATAQFYHVSTDEVYGTLGDEGKFTEETPYDPNSPYSASKASSDHFVRAYHETYKLPIVISNCSNNYGSHQFPEKLIPLMIHNITNNKPLPVYGKGDNIRDWLWVEDHARAIETIYFNGKIGETYNIGGNNEWKNIDLVHKLCEIMDRKLGRASGESAKLITYVTDRKGHDFRYAIDATKLERELGWMPSVAFDQGFEKTIDWYLENNEWLDRVTSGAYADYYASMYAAR